MTTLESTIHSAKCPACDQDKGPRRFFCRDCWYALPRDVRHALWQPLSEETEKVYERAMEILVDGKETKDVR